jgi:hypothetical protein
MDFEQYVGTHLEAYKDSSSDDEMDYGAPNFVYGNLIDLADANSTITPEGNVIRDEVLHAPVIVPEKNIQFKYTRNMARQILLDFLHL